MAAIQHNDQPAVDWKARWERVVGDFERDRTVFRSQLLHHLQPWQGEPPPREKALEWAWIRTTGGADTQDHVLLSADRDTPFVDPVKVAAVRKAFAKRGTLDVGRADSPDSRLLGDGSGRRSVLHVFSGPDGEPDALPRFRESARLSVGLLQECGFTLNNHYNLFSETILSSPVGPAVADLVWMLVCYNLAWDFPGRLNYRVEGLSLESDCEKFVPGPPRNPFPDRPSFERWCTGARRLEDGKYCFGLTRDVRDCSAEAARLILSMCEPVRPPGGRRQTRLEAHIEGETPYLTLDGKSLPAFDRIATLFVARIIAAGGEGVSYAQFKKVKCEYNKSIFLDRRFHSSSVTRKIEKLPPEVCRYITGGGKGNPYRLLVDDLQ